MYFHVLYLNENSSRLFINFDRHLQFSQSASVETRIYMRPVTFSNKQTHFCQKKIIACVNMLTTEHFDQSKLQNNFGGVNSKTDGYS